MPTSYRPLRPLLFVLGDRQSPIDLQALIHSAVKGKEKTETVRAGIELEKVITFINASVGGACSSLQSMAALMLPEQLTTLLWLSHLVFTRETLESDDTHFIEKRNRAARSILQSLAKFDLLNWQNTLLDQLPLTALPPELQFPPGHPLPGKAYRQHPLPSSRCFYYPTQTFYSYMRDEREAELVQIMADLGAQEIIVCDPSQASLSPGHGSSMSPIRRFHFSGRRWTPNMTLDESKYAWLSHETAWKTVILERIAHGCLEATIQLDIDFSRVLIEQLTRIKGLVNQFFSMEPESIDSTWNQTMQTHQFQIKFPQ